MRAEGDLLVGLDGLLRPDQQCSTFYRVMLSEFVHAKHNAAWLDRLALDRPRLGNLPVDLPEAHAPHAMTRSWCHGLHRQRPLIAPSRGEIFAAWAEVAPVRPRMRQRQLPADGDERARILVGTRQRDRVEQTPRVRMPHVVEDA